MKKTKPSGNISYCVPSYVVTRKDNEGCLAINLNTLKQYHFEGASAEIFFKISQKVSADKIISSLSAKAPGQKTLLQKEYARLIKFLLSKGLIEPV